MKKIVYAFLCASISCFGGTVKFSNQTTSTLYVMPLSKNSPPQVAGTLPAQGMGIVIQIPDQVDDILVTTKETMDTLTNNIKNAERTTLGENYYTCKQVGKADDAWKYCYAKLKNSFNPVSGSLPGAILSPRYEWIAFDPVLKKTEKPRIGFAKKIK